MTNMLGLVHEYDIEFGRPYFRYFIALHLYLFYDSLYYTTENITARICKINPRFSVIRVPPSCQFESCPWMRLVVNFFQPFCSYMGINLGCGKIRMTQKFLDRAQVSAAV